MSTLQDAHLQDAEQDLDSLRAFMIHHGGRLPVHVVLELDKIVTSLEGNLELARAAR